VAEGDAVKLKDFYGRRLQYHWPQHVTRPWLPCIRWRGMSDEFCNRSVWVTLPFFLGAVVIFYGCRLRTYDDGWCEDCRIQWVADTGLPYQVGVIGVSNGEPIFIERVIAKGRTS
jgi:hypothetical protein